MEDVLEFDLQEASWWAERLNEERHIEAKEIEKAYRKRNYGH